MDQSSGTIDYATFAERLGIRTDRWSLLKEVMGEWGLTINRAQGSLFSPQDVASTEARLGVQFPVALLEWYALPFRFHENYPVYGSYVPDPTENDSPDQLEEESGFVSFHREMQSCCEWGFKVADAELADPPIYNGMELAFGDWPRPRGPLTWIRQHPSLSDWAIHRTLCDGLSYGSGHSAWAHRVSQEQLAALLRTFRPMGFPTQPWFQTRLFGGPNAIVIVLPAERDLGWDIVRDTAPHPTEVDPVTWASYWEAANRGPQELGLYCRDGSTFDRLLSCMDVEWRLPSPAASGDLPYTA